MTDAGSRSHLGRLISPSVVISVAAVLAAALIGLVLIFFMHVSVSDAIAAFVDGTVGSPYSIAASINRSIAFALVGIGFVIANRANLVNVGGEGQIAVGGIAATAVALYGHVAGLPFGLAFILAADRCELSRATLWGAIAAVMKIKAGTNEVISTLAAFVHRRLAAVLDGPVGTSAAQADDEFRHAAGIARDSRSDKAAASDRRLFVPAAYRACR